MASILLRHGYVVTVGPDRRVFPDGYVHVDGERIAAVGPMDQLAPAFADDVDVVLDLGGKLVIPGLINLHDHHWASMFKGFDEGAEMEPWLVSHVIPISMALSPGDLHIASYVSSLEMVRYGVTCSVNHLANVNDADSFAGMARAGQEVGVRQVIAKEDTTAQDSRVCLQRRPTRVHRQIQPARRRHGLAAHIATQPDLRIQPPPETGAGHETASTTAIPRRLPTGRPPRHSPGPDEPPLKNTHVRPRIRRLAGHHHRPIRHHRRLLQQRRGMPHLGNPPGNR
jgi:hypothetical protein